MRSYEQLQEGTLYSEIYSIVFKRMPVPSNQRIAETINKKLVLEDENGGRVKVSVECDFPHQVGKTWQVIEEIAAGHQNPVLRLVDPFQKIA